MVFKRTLSKAKIPEETVQTNRIKQSNTSETRIDKDTKE